MKFPLLFMALLSALPASVLARDYSDIFAKLDSAVVLIHTSESSNKTTVTGFTRTTDEALGSGVIISPDGLIITAAHVVHSADLVEIELLDGSHFAGSVLSSVVSADLALVQLLDPPENLNHVEPGDSDNIKIGEEVFVIGAPYGLKHTFTAGHLSGRRIKPDEFMLEKLEFLQTDAAINQGNSGGPLFTSSGELIGIVSHIKTEAGGNMGLGFAASTNMAKRLILDQPRLWFGIRYIFLQGEMLSALNAPISSNALLIQHVAKGSLGDTLGLRAGTIEVEIDGQTMLLGGDIITQVGGDNLYATTKGWQRVKDYFRERQTGEEIKLTVLRSGRLLELSAPKP